MSQYHTIYEFQLTLKSQHSSDHSIVYQSVGGWVTVSVIGRVRIECVFAATYLS